MLEINGYSSPCQFNFKKKIYSNSTGLDTLRLNII